MLSHFVQLWRRLRYYRSRARFDADLDEEMRFHLEMKIEENLAAGMNEREAVNAARRQFGNPTWLREESNQMWSFRSIESLAQDVRFGLRMMGKNPGFTAIAVFTLALGIGANTAIFTVVNSLLLRPLPFNDSGRLVQVWEASVKLGRGEMPASFPNFADWRDQNHVFDQTLAYADWSFNLTGTGEPERIRSAIVSPPFFETLGIRPIAGRGFVAGEDQKGKDAVAVISERLWRRRFNADPEIVGKPIDLNGESFSVVGVIAPMPELPGMSDETELWVPVSHGFGFNNRRGHYLNVIARLKPGVTREQGQADMDALAGALAAQYPEANADRSIRLVPLHEQIVGDVRPALLVLLGAVIAVLLIASANVASMLLARAASRQKEIAIRTALGAGHWRLVRQLLTESLLLSIVGGGLGLLLALWGVGLLVSSSPADLPRIKEVTVDARVLGFTLAVSLLTGIVFGFMPAVQASRTDLNETLKESGRSVTGGAARRRARGLLVVSEIALSLVLLIGAGLLMRSFLKLQSVDPGFNPENVLTMQIDMTGPNYQRAAPVIAFHNQLLERVRALPGVQSAATRSAVPIAADASFSYLAFAIEGRPPEPGNRPVAFYNAVSPSFFETMQIPVLKGRPFNEHDVRKAQNVIIINETLARRFFADEEPLGKRMTLNDENPKEEDWATIVGVVKDTKPRALAGEAVAEMYMPFDQQPEPSMSLMIRAAGKPEGIAAAVRGEVQGLDKNQPVYSVRTLEHVLSESVSTPRFRTFLLGVFAAVALILASVGIYGVMSYSVTQRTHEIGVRMALGAQTVDVLNLVVGQGARLAAAGVGIGLLAALALTRLLKSLLFGISATDPVTFVAVTFLLAGVALLACYLPARRASKVDPMIALRYE
ncbi:MAG TPA: ABC transporter permease [Blastocatellia bacterium]|nr:ABC transporter permease [Blastocatellia bacterium]